MVGRACFPPPTRAMAGGKPHARPLPCLPPRPWRAVGNVEKLWTWLFCDWVLTGHLGRRLIPCLSGLRVRVGRRWWEKLALLWKLLLETGDSQCSFKVFRPHSKCPKVKFIGVSNSPENSWLQCRIPLISSPRLEPCNLAKAAAHPPPPNLYTKIDTCRRSLLS